MKNKIFLKGLIIISLIFFLFQYPLFAGANQSLQMLFEEALQQSKEGDFYQALKNWNQYLKLFPNDPAALSNRGNVRLALGDPEGAIEDQTKTIYLSPDDLDPYLNRGVAFEYLKKWDKASQDYQWVLNHDSKNSSALYNLGNVSGSQGDWIKAKELFQQSSIENPGFAMAVSSKALSLYQLGEFEEAEKEFRKLIRKYPVFADARAALSALLWRKHLIGEAESNWASVLGLDDRYVDKEWLLNIRRWPAIPVADLMAFLELQNL
tara:strand:+ start:710 stop:1504 length:795 start_codon:yes stop_codon:yes gene_type:complete